MWGFEAEPEFQEKLDWVDRFVREEVEPLDVLFHKDQCYNPGNEALWAIMAPLKKKVREQGLWACHLPKHLGGDGWGQLHLAQLNQILGRSYFAPSVFGTAAPDTGNAEILAHFGTEEQKANYLQPLLDGDIVSCFSMTEPQAGADPKQFTCKAEKQADGSWRLNGEKWYSSNGHWAEFLIVMAVTDPDVPIYQGATMFIVPRGRAGVNIIRNVGLSDEMPGTGIETYFRYEDVVLSDDDILGNVNEAFKIAQFRLGGGRIHHAMRTIGLAKKAFDMTCERVLSRYTQGSLLAEKQMIQEKISTVWMDIEQLRLFVMQTAWKIDKYNDYKKVRKDISAAKVLMEKVLLNTVNTAIHIHGSLGITNEMPFGDMLYMGFVMGLADGPTEVHQVAVAKQVLRDYKGTDDLFPSQHVLKTVAAAREKYKDYLHLSGPKSRWVEYLEQEEQA